MADEVGVLRFLIESEAARGPFNLSAPNPVTNAQFTKALGKALRRPTVFAVPGIALRAVYGEMAQEALLEGQRALPARLLDTGFEFSTSTIDDALRQALADR
jgi:NAD dependent epimerase/dehydratase family enzyme